MTSCSFMLIVREVVVFVDHFLWKTVTIEEDTFSIPIRKTKYKTDTHRDSVSPLVK